MVTKWTLVATLFLMAPLSIFGQTLAGVNGECQVGGQQTLTSGLPSTGTQQIGTTNVLQGAGVQASFPSCLITVYLTGTITKANIFSNNNPTPTPVSNPFTANGDGSYTFFVGNACYDVVLSSGSVAMPYSRTIADICPGGNSGGGGGGGGTVGPGTQTHIPVFSSPTTIGDSEGISTGTGPVQWPLGVSLGTNALFYNKCRNGSTGTTANLLVAYDASGCAINAQPTDTQNLKGIARSTGTGGTVDIAYSGQYNLTFDNQTAIGDWAILGSGSQGHDAGAVQPSGIDTIGKIDSVNAGAGTLAVVEMNLPDVTNTSSGGGTGIVSPCATPGSIYYAQTVSSTATCDPGLTTDGAGGLIGASFTSNGPGGGLLTLFGSSSGSCPLSVDATGTTLVGTCDFSIDQNGLILTNTAATPSTSSWQAFINSSGRGVWTFSGSATSSLFFDVDGGIVFNPSASSANKFTFNNAGVYFAGSSATLSGGTISCAAAPHGSCSAVFNQPIILAGNTSGGIALYAQDIAGSHAIGFPAADGTVALTSNTSAVNSTFVNNPITSTYVATKNGPYIDPVAWGADPTGSTDSTTAWQNAVDYMQANRGTIICSGSYKLNRVLLAGNDFIQGTGPTNERGCNITPVTDAALVTSATVFAGSIYLSDITFHNGSNPIDFPLVNDVYFTRLNLDEPTGCGIVMAAAERYHIYDVTGSWNSATGFATLCTGDPSKSIFSATIPGGSPIGSSLPTVYGLSNLTNGPNKSGSAHTQWLWWEGTSMDGASIHQLYCSFGCESGIWSVGSLVPAQVVMENTTVDGIQLDNIGLVATPAAKAINIAGKMFYSSIRDYNPCWNTNHIAIDLYIEAFQGADIKNYCGTAGVNNTTTFGIVVGSHGGAVGQITASQGGLFSSGANEQNEISIIGSDMTPNNFPAGAIINERENKGVQVTLDAAGGNTGVATSSWTVKRSAGSGSYTTDISSNGPAGTGFIANEDVTVADGTFGSSQKSGRSACETNFGGTNLTGGSATVDTGLSCLPANSIIDAVVYRITVSGNGFTSFTVGDATTVARFCGTQSTVTSGTTGICFVQADQTGAAGPRQSSAAKVRVTTNAGGSIFAGILRLIVYYHTWTAPTS